MKRLRVSDIEALLGPAATAGLVRGVTENRGKREYEIEVSLIFTHTDRAMAKSEKEARKYLEGVTREQFRVADQFADNDETGAPVWLGWAEVRSRKAPVTLSSPPPTITPTDVQIAKGPGGKPRPKRVPRPSRD